MGRRNESEPEDGGFESYRRVSRAWQGAPKAWREVQAGQLNDAMSELRDRSEEKEGADAATKEAPRARRFRLVRRLSH